MSSESVDFSSEVDNQPPKYKDVVSQSKSAETKPVKDNPIQYERTEKQNTNNQFVHTQTTEIINKMHTNNSTTPKKNIQDRTDELVHKLEQVKKQQSETHDNSDDAIIVCAGFVVCILALFVLSLDIATCVILAQTKKVLEYNAIGLSIILIMIFSTVSVSLGSKKKGIKLNGCVMMGLFLWLQIGYFTLPESDKVYILLNEYSYHCIIILWTTLGFLSYVISICSIIIYAFIMNKS